MYRSYSSAVHVQKAGSANSEPACFYAVYSTDEPARFARLLSGAIVFLSSIDFYSKQTAKRIPATVPTMRYRKRRPSRPSRKMQPPRDATFPITANKMRLPRQRDVPEHSAERNFYFAIRKSRNAPKSAGNSTDSFFPLMNSARRAGISMLRPITGSTRSRNLARMRRFEKRLPSRPRAALRTKRGNRMPRADRANTPVRSSVSAIARQICSSS